MKSDTTRTDAAILDEHDPVTAVAHTCRQLERDLNSVVNQWSSDVDRMERELAKARERIRNLERAVSLVSPRCEHMHHDKKHRHGACNKCPVEKLFIKLTE